MDSFEQLICDLLWHDGYWVQSSVKVNLTKDEKKAIGKPTSPRWEIDVVAYSGRDNLLRVIECKSYLDSTGVTANSLIKSKDKNANRYKLFTDNKLREVVFSRLISQFNEAGLCNEKPEVRLGLACGHIAKQKDKDELVKHFNDQNWDLLDKEWIKTKMISLAKDSYENKMSSVVSKLLLRDQF